MALVMALVFSPMSSVLLDECFANQGGDFVRLLRECDQDRRLAGLADRMIADPRPWVRGQILAYLETPFDRPGHHPLVKRLFKHAEKTGDLDAMARFLVGFDRGIRRKLVRRTQWDWRTRTPSETEELVLSRRGLEPQHAARHKDAPKPRRVRAKPGMMLFSRATKLHLRRRVWRFFRRLGFQAPARYVPAISVALMQYTDADLASGPDLLESWGLAHVLFGKSPVLQIQGSWINIAPGRELGQLESAPVFAPLWMAREATPHLLTLATRAKAKLVRTWAQDFLAAHHPTALSGLDFAVVRDLLDGEWEDVRVLAVGLFEKHPRLATLMVQEWLALLGVRDPSALAVIVTAMTTHVRGSRLSTVENVTLACHRAVPVVRLALKFLTERRWENQADLDALRGLRAAACPVLAGELGKFLLERLATKERYAVDAVLIALDHRLDGMRTAAMAWVEAQAWVRGDAVLWARAAESPHDSVRGWLLRCLENFAEEAEINRDHQRLLWASVLLGIHRGGRAKQAALRQLGNAIVSAPDAAAAVALLPLLATALRSLRLPERRAGIAGIAMVLVRRPELRPQVVALFPELDLTGIVPEAVGAP